MKQYNLKLEHTPDDCYKIYVRPNKWFSILLLPFAQVSSINLMKDPWVLIYSTDDCIKAFEYIEQIKDVYVFEISGKKYIEIDDRYYELIEQEPQNDITLATMESFLSSALIILLGTIFRCATPMGILSIPIFFINFYIVYSNRHILGTELISKKRRSYVQRGKLTPIGYSISNFPTDFSIVGVEEKGKEIIWKE